MKKFGDFIKQQAETIKVQNDKINRQQIQIQKFDAELKKERGHRQYILDNMGMSEQARVALGQKCANQEKENKQLNRLYLQMAAEKTELNRAKQIAEGKLEKKKEKQELLQNQLTVTIKQYQ
jgi:chromosome segregation ATPase